jgi:hypothetical protein
MGTLHNNCATEVYIVEDDLKCLGPVVQRPDGAIHQIMIFSSFVKSVVDWYNSYLKFSIYKLNGFYTSCVVYIRNFTVFQAFYKG